MNSLMTVESRGSDVSCPNCGQSMRKLSYPSDSWPRSVSPAQSVSRFLGLAFCDLCRRGPHEWRMMA